MRLGREEAVGYVEDTEADLAPAEEITAERSEQTPLTPAPPTALPVG
jgi:hypothetical protein